MLCTIVVHGVYNVGTGVILNDLIGSDALWKLSPTQCSLVNLRQRCCPALHCYKRPSWLRTDSNTGETNRRSENRKICELLNWVPQVAGYSGQMLLTGDYTQNPVTELLVDEVIGRGARI